ncbi:MAG: hypothetical protein O3A46_16115 [Candidatus Poribacteria bacterium]|nr:hypothetical protein [Candidatus Poribacteria bacterium]
MATTLAEITRLQTRVATLPPQIDLNPRFDEWGISVRPQFKRPTCSVFAVIGALEYAFAQHRGNGVHLSVEFLNWAGHRATGRTVDGGFFWELWNGYEAYGVCDEATLPYDTAAFDNDLNPSDAVLNAAVKSKGVAKRLHWIKEWDPKTGLTDDEFEGVKRALADGTPVCGGFRWPHQAEWTDNVLHMREPHEVRDGHSILLSGYRDDDSQPGGGVFLIRNSGDRERLSAMPYAYACLYMNDAAWIEPRVT